MQRFFGFGNKRILGGMNRCILDDEKDLVALAPYDDDRLTSMLKDHFGYCFRSRRNRPNSHNDTYYFAESQVQLVGNIISTIFCAILLPRAMTALSSLDNRAWSLRLITIALFTTAFAIIVGILTNARRAEIFGSSAAYAAVLVVFVSRGLGKSEKG